MLIEFPETTSSRLPSELGQLSLWSTEGHRKFAGNKVQEDNTVSASPNNESVNVIGNDAAIAAPSIVALSWTIF